MANHSGMLYTGVTNDLRRRLYVHKHGLLKGYTSKYNIKTLVYYEVTSDIRAAIAREKQIKGWVRRKKVTLIESVNPKWEDMSRDGSETTRLQLQADLVATGAAVIGAKILRSPSLALGVTAQNDTRRFLPEDGRRAPKTQVAA
jgi:putative endonuclease